MPNDQSNSPDSCESGALNRVPTPPALQPPPVDQSAWNQSVEQTHVTPKLTVHQVGLSVFGETQSLSDLPTSNEPIDTAREKVAHMIINGAPLPVPPSVHPPVEPSAQALSNPDFQAAYDSSMRAAREAFLAGDDPTQGAIFLRMPTTATRANAVFRGGLPEGVPISTQSGPFYNSSPNKQVPSNTAWVNTYFPPKK